VCKLSEENGLRVTVKESIKGGVIAGCGALAGGLVGGPVGIAVGATIGGIIGAAVTSGNFESVVVVIERMDRSKQLQLAALVTKILSRLDITDAAMLMTVVTGDPMMQKQIVGTVITFLKQELRMEVLD